MGLEKEGDMIELISVHATIRNGVEILAVSLPISYKNQLAKEPVEIRNQILEEYFSAMRLAFANIEKPFDMIRETKTRTVDAHFVKADERDVN